MAAIANQPGMRTFGRVEDLDLEFASTDRPTLVTALLARCAGGDPEYWWMQPVGARAAALLELFALNGQTDQVEFSASCAAQQCGETFGFALPLLELAAQVPREEACHVSLSGGRRITLRRPIGRDLLRWRAARPATREQALTMMLDDLVLDGRPEVDDVATLAEALADSDPLVALSVAAECPACGLAQDVAIDVEGLVLAHFRQRQRVLLHDVHRLATEYGWTESEVLNVPPSRRAVYLSLIDGAPG